MIASMTVACYNVYTVVCECFTRSHLLLFFCRFHALETYENGRNSFMVLSKMHRTTAGHIFFLLSRHFVQLTTNKCLQFLQPQHKLHTIRFSFLSAYRFKLQHGCICVASLRRHYVHIIYFLHRTQALEPKENRFSIYFVV